MAQTYKPNFTTHEQWQAAVREIKEAGVHVEENVERCCRSCIDAEMYDHIPHGTPFAYTYGSQGSNQLWKHDILFFRDSTSDGWRNSRAAKEVYWNFNDGNSDLNVGEIITNAFRGKGFEVNWNGDNSHCPTIVMNQEEKSRQLHIAAYGDSRYDD